MDDWIIASFLQPLALALGVVILETTGPGFGGSLSRSSRGSAKSKGAMVPIYFKNNQVLTTILASHRRIVIWGLFWSNGSDEPVKYDAAKTG
ncbi:hypothetical protein MCOR25_010231 [Pyricularia grisea]|nr:hypothetical protein MCOR25_010231 [Pyricularia grisea]